MKTATNGCSKNLRCNRFAGNVFLSAVVCQLFFCWTSARGQQRGVPPEREVIVLPVVVDFTELARRETAAPLGKPVGRAVPFKPMPPRPAVPAGMPVRKAVAPFPPALNQASPLAPSPAPAASFIALDDDDTIIPPDTQGARTT
jgi:hypothetical protein